MDCSRSLSYLVLAYSLRVDIMLVKLWNGFDSLKKIEQAVMLIWGMNGVSSLNQSPSK